MYRRPPTGCQLVEPQSKPGSDPTAPHSLSRCSFLFPPLWPRGARCGHAILRGTVHRGLERAWAPPPHGSPSLYGCLAGLQAGDGHVRAPVCPMRTQMPCRGWVSPRQLTPPSSAWTRARGPGAHVTREVARQVRCGRSPSQLPSPVLATLASLLALVSDQGLPRQ